MASGLYLEAVKRFLGGGGGAIDVAGASTSVFVALITNGYTFDGSNSVVSAITGAASANRCTKVTDDTSSVSSDTVLDATLTTSAAIVAVKGTAPGIVFTGISTSQTLGGLLIYYKVTNDSDSIPICFISIASQQTNGATINVNWDTGTNKIFSINATPA